MLDGEVAPPGGAEGDELREAWFRRAVHDLCQPLTALECLLYVNREPVAGEPLEAALLRNVMEEGLVECKRMLMLVKEIQERMASSEEVSDRMG
jgi:hypothetical protein